VVHAVFNTSWATNVEKDLLPQLTSLPS